MVTFLKLNWWVYLPLPVMFPVALPVVRFPLLFPVGREEVGDKAVMPKEEWVA